MRHNVAIQKCSSYSSPAVYNSIKDTVMLASGGRGMSKYVKKGERILLKPNLLAPKNTESAVTTHPLIVKAAIELVREAGAEPVVGDSPALGSARKVARKSGILEVVDKLSVELIELNKPVVVDNPNARTFKRLEIAEGALTVDGIINLPKLKTHAQMYLTMGIKNIFGCVAGKRKAQWHLTAGVDIDYFAEMILDLYLYVKPRLTIMDAVVSMEGNGPASGEPRNTGFVAASADAVALDTVITEALGARITDVPVLKAARKRRLDSADPGNIDVVGCPVNDIKVSDFKFPPLVSVNFSSFLPGVLDKRVRKALTSRPYIDPHLCKNCELCIKACPAEKISGKKELIIDSDGCIRCYCCQEICPWGAITVKEGWLKRIIPGL